MEGEIHLPKAIIQHIQSFMEDECAAQTSLLSKYWYDAWSTRPVLVLRNNNRSGIFWNFARKAIQRYVDQNISVDILTIQLGILRRDFCHLDKLISDASKLRMNELYLAICSVEFYDIPAQLFEQRYLRKIYSHGCKIDQQLAKRVPWPHLVTLSLSRTYIDNDTLWQILSRCPLIEYLKLTYNFLYFTKINVSKLRNLETFIVKSYLRDNVSVEFGECPFLNLTRLVLKNVQIDYAFFNNLAYKCPNLEVLTLEMLYHGCQNIRISSRSVKFLRFLVSREAMVDIATFEVPNVSKFVFSCHDIPTVSFTAVTKQMESEISFRHSLNVEFPNFLVKLRNLLEYLRQSKISLTIEISDYNGFSSMTNIGTPPVVENLLVSFYHRQLWTFSNAVCGLLWCCRPKFINVLCYREKTDVQVLLHGKLIEQANHNRLDSVSTQHFRCLYDLKEVSVEVLKKSVMEWQPIKASKILHCGDEKLRFKLIWGTVTPEHTIVNFVERSQELC